MIDGTSIRRAISKCDLEHAGVCHSIQDPWAKLTPVAQIIVIDVDKQSLSFKLGSCRYVALSYVWGAQNAGQRVLGNRSGQNKFTSQTTTGNFSQLCQSGAFRKLAGLGLLPATVRDSMLVVRHLGLRYLWDYQARARAMVVDFQAMEEHISKVDRFCIIQDDPNHKHSQIQAMAAIYSNSYFTIAACEGEHNDSGLHGVGRHRPRKDPFHRFEFNDNCRIVAPAKSHRPHRKIRLLQARVDTVSWICKQTLENEIGLELPQNVGIERLHSVFSAQPDIYAYATAVQAYSSRSLTYAEDTLVAFSCIMVVMGKSMAGGILFGLLEMFFDGVLLWEPSAMGTLTRRPGACADGWEGKITTSMWKLVYDYDLDKDGSCVKRHRSSVYLTPIARMYKTDEATQQRTEIRSKFLVSTPRASAGEEVSYERLGERFRFQAIPTQSLSAGDNGYSPILEFRARRLASSRLWRESNTSADIPRA
ncbi:hypothetical protein P171DRAFT_490850 [Karstenula rhodostoma CBS 690.94]|uniref:Heterokaryon incompatibility domain-containing protein n=1 Tax=Karstenula rhodostoma CBS 690.94 TaxID=1392251 RepID=A0A9P4P940_9PLEO|nr:hypothetical protein P171DRAFT_490850 [Karstenula rhodostoma CBS 690.94]